MSFRDDGYTYTCDVCNVSVHVAQCGRPPGWRHGFWQFDGYVDGKTLKIHVCEKCFPDNVYGGTDQEKKKKVFKKWWRLFCDELTPNSAGGTVNGIGGQGKIFFNIGDEGIEK